MSGCLTSVRELFSHRMVADDLFCPLHSLFGRVAVPCDYLRNWRAVQLSLTCELELKLPHPARSQDSGALPGNQSMQVPGVLNEGSRRSGVNAAVKLHNA